MTAPCSARTSTRSTSSNWAAPARTTGLHWATSRRTSPTWVQRSACAVSMATARWATPRCTLSDATWRGECAGLRGGYHHLDTEFTSLSLFAQPGVHETYVGVDWTAAPWVMFTTDIRKSKNSTLANAYSESTFVDTDAVT